MLNLRLLQISDSALPVGGYMHSWGLEAAVARHEVVDAPGLERWVRDWLRYSLGPLEGIIVAASWRASVQANWSDVTRAAQLLTASLSPPTIRRASLQMGEQLASLGSTWHWSRTDVQAFERECPPGDRHHAVVYGLLAALAGAGEYDTLACYLNQAALGMIGAGVRCIPVGHTHGQQILAYLHEDLGGLALQFQGRPLHSAGASSPYYEVLCDAQSRLFTRLFRS